MKILSVAKVVAIICTMSLPALSSEQTTPPQESCESCLAKVAQKRWDLRQECLEQEGQNETTCNGRPVGKTCCHCTKSPEEDPNCWERVCPTECSWKKHECKRECRD